MPQIVTFGETMATFTPSGAGPLRYIPDYRMRIAGTESNLAIGVCKLGHTAGWASRLGDDEFGHFVLNQVRAEGVDTSGVKLDKAYPTGLMFKETGAGETKVYYYRAGSSASHIGPEDVDEAYIREAEILYLTGITPVLSDSCREAVLKAMAVAKANHVKIAFDPNIRRRLWDGRDYGPLLKELALDSDIVLMGLDEAEALFGGRDVKDLFKAVFASGRTARVVIKDGARGAWVGKPGRVTKIEPYPCRCIEPVGAGDAFNAGFLCGVLEGYSSSVSGRMGAICGALATQTPGDIEGYPSAEELDKILHGGKMVYR